MKTLTDWTKLRKVKIEQPKPDEPVVLPPRKTAEEIDVAASRIAADIEAARRLWDQCMADSCHTDARFKTSAALAGFVPNPAKHRPPDLHAANLSFAARLVLAVGRYCDGRAALAYKRAGLSAQVYSRLAKWDDSQPKKMTVMRFCIGLQLPMMDEAKKLMSAAGYALSPTITADGVFIHCIKNEIWNILDVNELLVRNGLPALSVEN